MKIDTLLFFHVKEKKQKKAFVFIYGILYGILVLLKL